MAIAQIISARIYTEPENKHAGPGPYRFQSVWENRQPPNCSATKVLSRFLMQIVCRSRTLLRPLLFPQICERFPSAVKNGVVSIGAMLAQSSHRKADACGSGEDAFHQPLVRRPNMDLSSSTIRDHGSKMSFWTSPLVVRRSGGRWPLRQDCRRYLPPDVQLAIRVLARDGNDAVRNCQWSCWPRANERCGQARKADSLSSPTRGLRTHANRSASFFKNLKRVDSREYNPNSRVRDSNCSDLGVHKSGFNQGHTVQTDVSTE